MTGRTCLSRDRKWRSSHQTLGPRGSQRAGRVTFDLDLLDQGTVCFCHPASREGSTQASVRNNPMKSWFVWWNLYSNLADCFLSWVRDLPHVTTEWPPWCCQSDKASLNFRLEISPIPVWSLSFFHCGPSRHNQRNRRYHVVAPVKVMACMAFSSSGWCNEPYLIPWLLFTSPSVSFSSSGYKRAAVAT